LFSHQAVTKLPVASGGIANLDLEGREACIGSLWVKLGRLDQTHGVIRQLVIDLVQLGVEFFDQCLFTDRIMLVPCRKVCIPRETRAVIADRHEQPTLHDHLGAQSRRATDSRQDNMNSLPKPFLVVGRSLHPANDIDFSDRLNYHRRPDPLSATEH